ncbi:Mad3/BUB1 homology region 1-domain-containing protein [Kalaharituber pfeilii]|nr:Mad3/BUB1 homology region 1-domain-containing protein [Kalaharituber pfeilii]
MGEPVNFDLIEGHKENIMPLAGGRSARALATALAPLSSSTPQSARSEHNDQRAAFEAELLTSNELDDPLEVWVRYVNWVIQTFPSGHNSESGLVQLLERATKTFIHEPHYKNDPRYLRFWIYYIQKFSDAPREHFSYLARNDIGQRLALFYEEFAILLESLGRWKQAREIYQLGIENNARPVERLMRKFDEFLKRLDAAPQREDEPSSPALHAVRPALATKHLPFSGLEGSGGFSDPQAQPSTAAPAPKLRREKMAIFSDADNGGAPAKTALGPGQGGWDSIGTLEHRRKENIVEPRPWAGEVLKQQGGSGKTVGEKMPIFRDSTMPAPSATAPAADKRPEPIVPNFNTIYPDPNDPTEEYSFEEIRAIGRGLYGIDWAKRRVEDEADRKRRSKRPTPPNDPFPDISTTPPRVQTIQTKLHSPSPGRGKLKKRSQQRGGAVRAGSPTMTINTRVATDEVYDILNHPIDHPNKDLDEVSDFEEDADDITINVPARNAASDTDESDEGEGSGSGSGSGGSAGGGDSDEDEDDDANSAWSDLTTRRGYVDETVGLSEDTVFQKFDRMLKKKEDGQEKDEDEDEEDLGDGKNSEGSHDQEESEGDEPELPPLMPNQGRKFGENNRNKHYMTPIVERTEVSLPPTTARKKAAAAVAKTPSRTRKSGTKQGLDLIMSSPFEENVGRRGSGGGTGLRGEGIGEQSSSESDDIFSPPPRPNLKGAVKPFLDEMPVAEKIEEKKLEEKKATPLGEKKPAAALAEKRLPLGTKKPGAAPASGAGAGTQATTAKDIAPKGGPICTETQLNPMDSTHRKEVLSKLNPPLKMYEKYYEYGTDMVKADIAKMLKPVPKGNAGGDTVPVTFPGKPKEGAVKYIFRRQIGEGAFAPVYLVENPSIPANGSESSKSTSSDNDENANDLALVTETRNLRRRPLEAIKVENDPPSPWEFYIMRQAHRRLGVSRPSESILHALEMHLYPNAASFLVLPYQNQGTVLDLVNVAAREATATGAKSQGLDEPLVMFLAVELLRTLEAIHSRGIIHGDLKPDNCLVRFEEVAESEWDSKYRRDGSGGWSKKGIVLIDFGRGIDMKLYRPDVQFLADWKFDPQTDCVEIREMRPWTYQIDYYGAAGIVHSLLFGKYLEIVADKGGGLAGIGAIGVAGTGGGKTWRVKESFKRYWQGEIWGRMFDVLLNPGRHVSAEDGGRLPVTKAVKGVREEMEKWLEGNADRGVGLKNVIRKFEGLVKARK